MHLGNLLCAMLAWLSARSQGGQFLLRVEDLDKARSPQKYANQLEADLRFLGFDWDAGGRLGRAACPLLFKANEPLFIKSFWTSCKAAD